MTLEHSPRTAVRWWIVVFLAGFSFVSYLERANISVAAELMIPALHITRVQMGQVFTAFLIGYAVFQIPGGVFGDRLGPRLILAVSALIWAATTFLTGLLPTLFHSAVAVFLALWIVRFFLGLSEATTFPVGNRVVGKWMPPNERATGSAVFMQGTCIASAIASPLVSYLMLHFGWQVSFYLTAIPSLVIAFAWYRFFRDEPHQHPRVNAAELAYIRAEQTNVTSSTPVVPFLSLLRQRNVFLLILSYVSEGYVLFIFVFWLYIYLVEQRGFTMIRGGWIAAIPWLTALVITPAGGLACDRLGTNYGKLIGAKIVIMAGYALSGVLLFLAAYAHATWLSVAALSFSIAFLMAAEAPFWATATYLGGQHVGTLSGVMNAAGVLGGIVSTSLVPILVERFGWLTALGSGTVMGLFCVSVWVGIREPGRAVRR